MSAPQNIDDVSQAVYDECGSLRAFADIDGPAVEEEGIDASIEGTEDIGLQVVANH